MKKIIFLISLVIVLIVLFFYYPTKRHKEIITLFNWGEFIDNGIIEEFNQQDPDFEIKQSFFVSNELAINKIKTGNIYDIVILSEYAIEKLKKDDYLTKLSLGPGGLFDESKPILNNSLSKILRNSTTFKEIFYNNDNKVDQNKDFYAIPYVWGNVGLLYNKKIIENMNMKIDEWKSILKNPKIKISLYNNPKDVLFIGLKATDCDNIEKPSDEQIKKAKEWLVELKKTNSQLSFVTDQILDNMKEKNNERYDISLVYSGDAAFLMDQNDNLSYYTFDHEDETNKGTNIWIDGIIIPKDANKKGAYKFINFLFNKDKLQQNYNYIKYDSPYSEDVPNIKTMSDGFNKNLNNKQYIIYNYDKELNKKIFDAWYEIYSASIESDKWLFIFSFFIIIFILLFNLFFSYSKKKLNLYLK
ncbi:ABC-type spermidine/putrescine transport, periplasmic component [Candidatus Phytoplasma mali]|uniref:ABC-type spermidine/putrescine transport, periplasmic component n=1 Tax=Phytoplasma mali (strain AT) TaxID=482235 RepID=B3QZU3_PHYMT|nr:extracellular solute-binding protein [Candidatus Phytoplasma mali]CAP18480.1 ABC-type spermidine/putrescine transport, periplasmic component [Candidatus Phytoplasma mali]